MESLNMSIYMFVSTQAINQMSILNVILQGSEMFYQNGFTAVEYR